jgi:DNA modification methylase
MMNRDNPFARLTIEPRGLGELKPNPRNARLHSRRQIKAIADSIQAYGFTTPILVDDADVILAGHGRCEAGKLLGLPQVPTIRIGDLSEAQKRAYVLADNKLAERAGWDREMLIAELGELSVILPDLDLSVELTGFELSEINLLLGAGEEEPSQCRDDEIVDPPGEPVTRRGDIWVLGRHRVMCADAREGAVLRALLGDELADMVFTDPPYSVPAGGQVMSDGSVTLPDSAMVAGEMAPEEFSAFLQEVLQGAVMVSREGALHYVCVDWRHIGELLAAGKRIYRETKDLCVWAKSKGGEGSLYRSQHELIAVFKVSEGDHVNNVEPRRQRRKRSNVWDYPGVKTCKTGRQAELAVQATVKPVALVADAIQDVTQPNAIVLDLFGGSGTTLIAAERTGRGARLVESEPRYVDATVARFQALTKNDARHGETGATFAQVAASRLGSH